MNNSLHAIEQIVRDVLASLAQSHDLGLPPDLPQAELRRIISEVIQREQQEDAQQPAAAEPSRMSRSHARSPLRYSRFDANEKMMLIAGAVVEDLVERPAWAAWRHAWTAGGDPQPPQRYQRQSKAHPGVRGVRTKR